MDILFLGAREGGGGEEIGGADPPLLSAPDLKVGRQRFGGGGEGDPDVCVIFLIVLFLFLSLFLSILYFLFFFFFYPLPPKTIIL